jgi:hypothetical protein
MPAAVAVVSTPPEPSGFNLVSIARHVPPASR